jgi:hypothetical protein
MIETTPTERALQEVLFNKYPGIGEAYQLYTTTHANAVGMRWEVEARLLCANETLESIAEKTGHQLGTVQWYENVFFNVRDRLGNLSYLFHHAVGHRGRAGIDEHDTETLWKVAALHGGAHLLDAVMYSLTPMTLDDPKHARTYLDSQNRDLLARQALIAGLTGLTPGRRDGPRLKVIALNAKMVEAENKKLEGLAGSPDDAYLEGLQMVLDDTKIYVAEKSDRLPAGVFPNGAEMRAADLLRQKMGLPVKLPEGFGERPFPTSRRADTAPIELEPADPVDPADREELA